MKKSIKELLEDLEFGECDLYEVQGIGKTYKFGDTEVIVDRRNKRFAFNNL